MTGTRSYTWAAALLALALPACAGDDLSQTSSGGDEDMPSSNDLGGAPGDMSGEDLSPGDLGAADMSPGPGVDMEPPTEDMSSPARDMTSPPKVEPSCVELEDSVQCPHKTYRLDPALFEIEEREVHWQLPQGEPPEAGWPAVIFFQGSLFSSEYSWSGKQGDAFGAYHQARTIQALLDGGFAVIAPEAKFNGSTYWDTNILPWAYSWTTAPDHRLMLAIFELIDTGEFGELDGGRLYAAGISSGGYMTSRMAVAYPGRFRALAIHSGSYATCAGYTCLVPDDLPEDHPPTLFLHGELDAIVPLYTMRSYVDELDEQALVHDAVLDPSVGHEWIPAAPEAIFDWFSTH